MVVLTDEGWMGAGWQAYGSPEEARKSFARELNWPRPEITPADRLQARRLKVFLCHANEDKPIVRTLRSRLLNANVDAWLDEVDILPGQRWNDEISTSIRRCDAFAACLSSRAVTKVGYINREFKEALEVADEQPQGKIFIIPVRLERCEVPARFADIQWVDYFDDNGFAMLLASLSALSDWLREAGSLVQPPSGVAKT